MNDKLGISEIIVVKHTPEKNLKLLYKIPRRYYRYLKRYIMSRIYPNQ